MLFDTIHNDQYLKKYIQNPIVANVTGIHNLFEINK